MRHRNSELLYPTAWLFALIGAWFGVMRFAADWKPYAACCFFMAAISTVFGVADYIIWLLVDRLPGGLK